MAEKKEGDEGVGGPHGGYLKPKDQHTRRLDRALDISPKKKRKEKKDKEEKED